MNTLQTPHVYTIEPGVAFADYLVAGFLTRFGSNPLLVAKSTIFVPSQRAVKLVKEAFLTHNFNGAQIVPAIISLGDIGLKDVELPATVQQQLRHIPRVVSPVRSKLLLAKLILSWQEKTFGNEHANIGKAAFLAGELYQLIDEVGTQQIDMNQLQEIVPDSYAKHWQMTFDFLSIIITHWPIILQEEGGLDVANYRYRALTTLANYWQETPPNAPVIVAGSTGTIQATRNLLKAVSACEHGHVILPAVDQHEEAFTCEQVDVTHPQYVLHHTLADLGLVHTELSLWHQGEVKANHQAKQALVRLAMAPSHYCSRWHEADTRFIKEVNGIALYEAETQDEEALAIALLLRECLEDEHQKAALVTNDKLLAKLVTHQLKRWGIKVDDSSGLALELHPAAIFLKLIIEVISKHYAPSELLALCKHPYLRCGYDLNVVQSLIRSIEINHFRGMRAYRNPEQLLELVGDEERQFLHYLMAALKPLHDAMQANKVSLKRLIRAHIKAAEILSTNAQGNLLCWGGEGADYVKNHVEECLQQSNEISLSKHDYVPMFDSLLAGQSYYLSHSNPRLRILSSIEARMVQANRVIIGGFNEGSWPQAIKADPWLNRSMREQLSLLPKHLRMGQLAHDVSQLLCVDEVILTRALKAGGKQTIPSRWLLRLKAVLEIADVTHLLQPPPHLASWVAYMNQPKEVEQANMPNQPLMPCPPVSARPTSLSVSAIEQLMRNPYGFYAQHILCLKELDPVDKDASVAELGMLVHDMCEWLLSDITRIISPNAVPSALAFVEQQAQRMHVSETTITIWLARITPLCEWFVADYLANYQQLTIRTETQGVWQVHVNNVDYRIHARADRIDGDGNAITLIDYKTGSAIAPRHIELGFSPQLIVEACIAKQGGFGANQRVQSLEYWYMFNRDERNRKKPITKNDIELEQLIEQTQEGVLKLLDIFSEPTTPYCHSPLPAFEPRYNPYRHLARAEEWEAFIK